ncbi:alpha/beta fold hydrolase [Nocardiopsis quinghaiensis]|uniref:alpha/beta fold hydrolase n=1 Tax=Nocardiopsis quinghaiensis TaxID=464995 RepID=UPI001CC257E4|nr:alpha/beta hydrolase [Nocardiopsis quinghaiensis]
MRFEGKWDVMDFVLVHGTAQSPEGWDPLRESLARRAHHSVVVDLPTEEPELTVGDYTRSAADQVDGRVRHPVVVAHSGSGVLLPAIADAVGAAAMVWLAAYVPDFVGGRSLIEEIQDDPTALFDPDWIGVNPVADHRAARRFLFHDCPDRTQEWALGTLREFAPAAVYGHGPVPERPGVESTFVLPTADRTLRPDWMRQAAVRRLGVRPREVDAGHCPHVCRPEATADILHGLRPGAPA